MLPTCERYGSSFASNAPESAKMLTLLLLLCVDSAPFLDGESGGSGWLDGGAVRSSRAPFGELGAGRIVGRVAVVLRSCAESGPFEASSGRLFSRDFCSTLLFDLRAFAIKSLNEESCLTAQAAPSKSLSLICAPMFAALDMVGARVPTVRSHISRSCRSSERFFGLAESQLAFHNVTHSWCLRSSI